MSTSKNSIRNIILKESGLPRVSPACALCGRGQLPVARELGVCAECLRSGRTLENFERAARRAAERPEPPLVIASTPLVPGYVDAIEVNGIARFIAGSDSDIPYSLPAFVPRFRFPDLPPTPRRQAVEAEAVARAAGLRRVRIGNRHLLT